LKPWIVENVARILIIDDEELVRSMLSQVLEFDGHTVMEAPDGEKGLAAYREFPADIVITDILMPRKEGIETIRELRRIDPNVKIIAMSGGGRIRNANFLDIAQKLGASAVLKKPFEMQALRDAVNACLETAGAARQTT